MTIALEPALSIQILSKTFQKTSRTMVYCKERGRVRPAPADLGRWLQSSGPAQPVLEFIPQTSHCIFEGNILFEGNRRAEAINFLWWMSTTWCLFLLSSLHFLKKGCQVSPYETCGCPPPYGFCHRVGAQRQTNPKSTLLSLRVSGRLKEMRRKQRVGLKDRLIIQITLYFEWLVLNE